MKTRIYSGYHRRWLALLLLVFLLAVGGLYFVSIYRESQSPAQREVVTPVRREGCDCALDHNLPVLVVDTNGQDIHTVPDKVQAEVYGQLMELHEPSTRYAVDVAVYEPGEYGYTCTCGAAAPSATRPATISLRGQSTLSAPKKQYTLNFVDEEGNDQPLSLLGMPSHHQWVLNGSYVDKSLLRNALAFSMGSEVMDYAPRFEYCEVLLNNDGEMASFASDYIGVYLLTEKIERDPNRVDIKRADARYSDLSFIIAWDKIKVGDEVLYTDWSVLEDEWIVGANGQLRQRTVLTTTYPGASSMTAEYRGRIRDYLNEFEYALSSREFDDAQDGYRPYIDCDSFVQLCMINEVFKNVDGGEVSTYYYKDIGGRLKAGPLWDFDLTLGNTDLEELREPTGLRMIDVNWYAQLFKDDYFADKYEKTYHDLRKNLWSDEKVSAKIEELQRQLGPAVARNNERWYADTAKFPGYSYETEVAALKDFLSVRLAWMDRNIHLVHRINVEY